MEMFNGPTPSPRQTKTSMNERRAATTNPVVSGMTVGRVTGRLTSMSKSFSTTVMPQNTLQKAPWRELFEAHISKMASPEFVLSTLSKDPASKFSVIPRARYCIYRGMWTALPSNDKNTAKQNSKVYDSDCPTFTTDIRMEKINQIFGSAQGSQERSGDVEVSGGGGPVEAVWWVNTDEVMTQWRIRGDAWVVGPDVDDETSEDARKTMNALQPRMRVLDDSNIDGWSWGRELTAHYGNLSPGMKGSFANPPPGKLVKSSSKEEAEKLGNKIEDVHDQEGRKNFRVVVIRPFSVESIDLKDPSKSRRQLYNYNESDNSWSHEELWP